MLLFIIYFFFLHLIFLGCLLYCNFAENSLSDINLHTKSELAVNLLKQFARKKFAKRLPEAQTNSKLTLNMRHLFATNLQHISGKCLPEVLYFSMGVQCLHWLYSVEKPSPFTIIGCLHWIVERRSFLR